MSIESQSPRVGSIKKIVIKTAEHGLENNECLKFQICRKDPLNKRFPTSSECCEASDICAINNQFQAGSIETIKGSALNLCNRYELPTVAFLELTGIQGEGCWKGDFIEIVLNNSKNIRCHNVKDQKICGRNERLKYRCQTK